MTFSPVSYTPPRPTKAQRLDTARVATRRAQTRIATLSDAGKIKALAAAMVDAWRARQTVVLLDLTQAGFSEDEVGVHYDHAMVRAQRIEPRMRAAS